MEVLCRRLMILRQGNWAEKKFDTAGAMLRGSDMPLELFILSVLGRRIRNPPVKHLAFAKWWANAVPLLIVFKKFKYENVVLTNFNHAPAILKTSDLLNEIIHSSPQSRETIPLIGKVVFLLVHYFYFYNSHKLY